MSNFRQNGRFTANGRCAERRANLSLGELLQRSGTRAPKPQLAFEFDREIDARPLSHGERERLLGMLCNSKDAEARCAAAYAVAKLGLLEALPIVGRGLRLARSDRVRFSLELAAETLRLRQELNNVPDRAEQLDILVGMRTSANAGERRFADIVIRRAGIKYGGISSW